MYLPKCSKCGYPTAAPVYRAGVYYCQDCAKIAPDMVNHPPHYTRGPVIEVDSGDCARTETLRYPLECIEVIRHI
ncbi:MAG: hypothetical protein J2P17_23755, partial [Mycobacterium sp.]|nr:hypothetical protein [Mycobacterium sp.]